MQKNILTTLFESHTGHAPTAMVPLTAAGSNRRYYRLSADVPSSAGTSTITRVGVIGTSVEENRAFIALSRHFAARQLPVPQVFTASADETAYLQTDLGSTSLYDYISACQKRGEWDTQTIELLHQVMRDLPALQYRGAEGLDFSCCYPQSQFDKRSVMWDLNYFKYCFLKATGLEFSEPKLEDDFERMAHILLSEDTPTFLYRDFQSRNVMLYASASNTSVSNESVSNDFASDCSVSNPKLTPYYIDFQGGRRGPVYYDVASFLWQARAAYPDKLRNELLETYLETLANYRTVQKETFVHRLHHFVLFRMMQVLGAYGFRGYFEQKAPFIVTIPAAIENLRQLIELPDFDEYPYLMTLLREMVQLPAFRQTQGEEGLTVHVTSFSYKKGIPRDASGNGGGFVFDCRSMNNPGRYDEYKKLTGLDAPVIKFLEDDGEILRFLEHVYALVDPAVARYKQRGFQSLMVSFGCTGGQHRSVYSAQHLAEHIAAKYGVRVHLWHREQHLEQTF